MSAIRRPAAHKSTPGPVALAEPGELAPGSTYMRALRRDHAGLSRMLREIDLQAGRLSHEPEEARALLVEAMRYLLGYHHAFHHPREDRLFARIRARDTALDATLADLSDEHEVGEAEAERLACDLETATSKQLRGRLGKRLTERVNEYVRHTRAHMRHEEAVFYARAEAALNPEDWREVIDSDHGPQDPMAGLAEMGRSYPRLAVRLGLPLTHLGLLERVEPVSEELKLQMLALTDLYGGLLHDALDLGRSHVDRLLAVRDPGGLLSALGGMARDNLDFAGRCLLSPPRWAVNTGAALVAASLRPYLEPRPSRD